MERNLCRIKNKKFPKQPKTAAEIQSLFCEEGIIKEFGYNLSNTERFYMNTVDVPGKYAFTIFGSIDSINIVKEKINPYNRKFLMDGTFKVTPHPYGSSSQLLIIFIEYENDVSSIER